MKTNNELSMFKRSLIWCSGADIELLKTCGRPVVMKYTQLGFLLLIPSLFALLSASYFLSTVFEKSANVLYIALGGGLFWSIVIFSLDRFLVMTFKKSKSALRDIFSVSVLSRMALAILVGYVVAHPLVLRMFEPNLKEILHERNQAKANAIAVAWDEKLAKVDTEISTVLESTQSLGNSGIKLEACTEDHELQQLITAKQTEISGAENEYADEISGGGRTRIAKVGSVAIAIRGKIDTLKAQLDDLQNRMARALDICKANAQEQQRHAGEEQALRTTQRQQLAEQYEKKQRERISLEEEKHAALAEFDKFAAYDFLTLSNTLEELGHKDPNVLFWARLLTAVLCAVDLLALLIKMTCQQDEYDIKKQADEYYRSHETEIQLMAHREIEHLHLESATEWQKQQASIAKMNQQAAHANRRLKCITDSLNDLAKTHNEHSRVMSFLQVMGIIPSDSAELRKMNDNYRQAMSKASSRLFAEATL